jgi:hypothetical protein
MKLLRTLHAALLAALVGHPAFGCKLVAGHEYRIPTRQERFAQADLVFTGKAVWMKKAIQLEGVAGQHPHTFVFTIEVDQWMKGSGQRRLEVFDTTGTDCDPTFGVQHLAMDADPLSSRWTLYVKRRDGHLWLTTAERLD